MSYIWNIIYSLVYVVFNRIKFQVVQAWKKKCLHYITTFRILGRQSKINYYLRLIVFQIFSVYRRCLNKKETVFRHAIPNRFVIFLVGWFSIGSFHMKAAIGLFVHTQAVGIQYNIQVVPFSLLQLEDFAK